MLTDSLDGQIPATTRIKSCPEVIDFNTSHHAKVFAEYDFQSIQNGDYIPAFSYEKEKILQMILSIEQSQIEPNFENTILPLSEWSEGIDRILIPLILIRDLSRSQLNATLLIFIKMEKMNLEEKIFSSPLLFSKIKIAMKEKNSWNFQKQKVAELLMENFIDHGVHLREDERSRLNTLNRQLLLAKKEYEENLIHAQAPTSFLIHITDPKEILGIPTKYLEKANLEARKRSLEGWVFLYHKTLVSTVLKTAHSSATRSLFLRKSKEIGNLSPYNNGPLVKQIMQLTQDIAKLLKFPSFADKALRGRMLSTPEQIENFLISSLIKTKIKAQEEIARLQDYKNHQSGSSEPLNESDISYWISEYKKNQLLFDETTLEPYFTLENVLQGLFLQAQLFYNLEFVESASEKGIVEGQKVFEVYEIPDPNNSKKTTNSEASSFRKKVGLVYFDLYSRIGEKRSGAWTKGIRNQNGLTPDQSPKVTPIVLLATNLFPPPENAASPPDPSGGPAPSGGQNSKATHFLTLSESTSLFHEFGHVLHHLLSRVEYEPLAGTSVARDFVEFPSKFSEKLLTIPSFLRRFAFHHSTHEPIPYELLAQYSKASTLFENIELLTKLQNAYIDLKYFQKTPRFIQENQSDLLQKDNSNLADFENSVLAPYQIVHPQFINLPHISYFYHIMTKNYSLGYYSYLWSSFLADQAFKKLVDELGDPTNPLVSTPIFFSRMKKLLSSGSSVNPEQLIEELLGHQSVDLLNSHK